jgi:hypothetical protein
VSHLSRNRRKFSAWQRLQRVLLGLSRENIQTLIVASKIHRRLGGLHLITATQFTRPDLLPAHWLTVLNLLLRHWFPRPLDCLNLLRHILTVNVECSLNVALVQAIWLLV